MKVRPVGDRECAGLPQRFGTRGVSVRMPARRLLLVATALALLAAPSAAPAATLDGLQLSGSVRPADRQALRGALASARPAAQTLVRDAGAAADVRVLTHVEPRWVSLMRVRRGRVELSFSRTHLHGLGARGRNQTVWHEIGHVVDLLFVSPAADDTFREAFARSANWRSCYRFAGQCMDDDEIFAEQFAFWATGDRTSRSSYRIPPLIGPLGFGRIMAAEDTSAPWWVVRRR
jgi:hypothetical protein